MAYLVDTDVLIYYLHDVPSASSLMERLVTQGISISAVTYVETLEGLGRSRDPDEEQRRLEAFSRQAPVFEFGRDEARIAVDLRRALRERNRSVRARTLDILIAATAISHRLTLITNNPSDYRDLPVLHVEPANIHL